jgi:cell division protein FtsA
LLIYPQVASFESANLGKSSFMPRMTGTGGRFQRMSQWFRDSF